jgi:hypothetical protein
MAGSGRSKGVIQMLFPVIAVVVGVLLVVTAFLLFKDSLADRTPPGAEPVPATGLQRMSFWAVIVGLIVIGAAAWFLISNGPVTVYDDDALRLTFTAILLVFIALFSVFFFHVHITMTKKAKLDERDLAILARAPLVQGALMLITMVAWVIGLQETFRGTPGVPVTYLQLMFWSVLAANMLAWPLGILIGYRRG